MAKQAQTPAPPAASYEVTLKRPVTVADHTYRPRQTHVMDAATFDALKAADVDAIATQRTLPD